MANDRRRALGIRTFWWLLVLPGCSGGGEEVEPQKSSIGSQFWKYDLSEYEIVDHGVLKGLGGRWISVRYERRAGQVTTKNGMDARITAALKNDGWEAAAPAVHWLGKKWEMSPSDVAFQRKARNEEPRHWFFAQRVHVSSNADFICIYAEVGW